MRPLIYEADWQKFDGYTPTFHHPHLKPEELQFLLGAAYARFYLRPSFLHNLCRLGNERLARLVDSLDQKTLRAHAQKEISLVSRAVTC